MASSLQKQLDKFRNPEFTFGTGSGRLAGKVKPSFLFDPKVAATYDLDAIYNIGRNGYAELLRMDRDRFSMFEEPLFSESAKATDRILQDNDFNHSLDLNIRAFLQAVSQYFLLKPAGKVIEWLIRRFRINEFNPDAVLACILPYYETQLFTNMLSTLDFSQCQQWAFLSSVMESGKPMARPFFIRRLFAEPALIEFICGFVQNAVKSNRSFSTIFTFYTATLLFYITEIDQVTDHTATMLMPYIFDGISGKNQEWRISNYLVLCQLAARSPLSEDALNEIVVRIYNRAIGSISQAVMTLVYLAQSQAHFPYKCDALPGLFQAEGALEALERFSVQYKCDNLWMALVDSLADRDRHDDLLKLLEHPRISLPAATVQKLVRSSLKKVVADQGYSDVVSRLLLRMQGRYSEILDHSVAEFINTECHQASKAHQTLVFSVLDACLGTSPHAALPDTGTTLLLAMRHPEDSYCHVAMRHLQNMLSASEVQFVDQDKKHLSESIVDALSRQDKSLSATILQSPILLGFAAQHATLLLANVLVSYIKQTPSEFAAMALLSLHRDHQETLASDSETQTAVELCARHIEVSHKDWFRSGGNVSLSLPTTEVIIQLMGVDHYALSGLHLVNPANIESLGPHVIKLIGKECRLAVRTRALEVTLGSDSLVYHRMALYAAFSLPDDMFNECSHLLAEHVTGPAALEYLCPGLLHTDALIVRRCLEGVDAVVCKTPGMTDFQVLLPHVVPCLLSDDKAVRLAVVSVLQSILKSITPGQDQAITKVQSPIGGYEKSGIEFVHPKVLRNWLKHVIDAGVAAASEAVIHISYRKKMSPVLDAFLSHMLFMDQPLVTVWLRILANVNSKQVFLTLHKHFQKMHSTLGDCAESSDQVTTLVHFINCITPSVASQILVGDSLQTIKQFLVGHATPALIRIQRATLTKITPELWNSLTEEQQDQILLILLNITAKSVVSDVVIEAKSVLRQIPLSVQVLIRMFHSLISTMNVDPSTVHAPKRSKTSNVPHQRLGKLTSLLELVSFKDVASSQLLIAPLFATLQAILNHQAYKHYDYIVQLVLSDLLHVDKCGLDESVYRIDLLVTCIRNTDNPQTHNYVLMVLSALSPQCADKVLLNLMPIFTFMGALVLRQDDEYTFSVIESTIAKIIPTLVLNVEHVKLVIQVFADAVSHIPVHRRLRLFTTLTNTLGPKYLYAIIALLLEQGHSKMLEFSLLLWAEFSVPEQLDCLIEIVRMCSGEDEQNSLPKEDGAPKLEASNGTAVQQPGSKRSKKIRIKKKASAQDDERLVCAEALVKLQQPLLVFVDEALMMRSFIKELTKVRVEADVKKFIEELLILVQRQVGNKLLLRIVYRVLDKVHHLLSLTTFLSVISDLWLHENVLIQKRAMSIFTDRIGHLSATTITKYEKPLVGTLPAILKLMNQHDDPELIQLCIVALQQLCIRFASKHPHQFMKYVPAVMVYIASPSSKSVPLAVTASAFVCISHFITQLAQQSVKYLNELMPALLTFLIDQGQAELLHRISALTCLEQTVRQLHAFMSPYLCRMLTILLSMRAESTQQSERGQVQQVEMLQSKLDNILVLIPGHVHSRYLVPALVQYTKTVKGTDDHITHLTKLVGQSVACFKKDDIKQNHGQLFDKVYLPIFDLDPFPQSVIPAFVDLVMKLNEDLFCPVFSQIYEWQQATPRRRQVFFQIVSALYDSLKNLLVSHVVPAFDAINESIIMVVRNFGTADVSCAQYALSVLYKTALYDTESVTESEIPSLANLCVLAMRVPELAESASKVLVQLAVTCHQDVSWKLLHGPILAAMCAHSIDLEENEMFAQVQGATALDSAMEYQWRKAAIATVGQIFETVGDGYLFMLPETMPAIAECLEDEELEGVAANAVRQIEAVLGEPLTKYLQK